MGNNLNLESLSQNGQYLSELLQNDNIDLLKQISEAFSLEEIKIIHKLYNNLFIFNSM